jgi:hypothetical protein
MVSRKPGSALATPKQQQNNRKAKERTDCNVHHAGMGPEASILPRIAESSCLAMHGESSCALDTLLVEILYKARIALLSAFFPLHRTPLPPLRS